LTLPIDFYIKIQRFRHYLFDETLLFYTFGYSINDESKDIFFYAFSIRTFY